MRERNFRCRTFRTSREVRLSVRHAYQNEHSTALLIHELTPQ